MAGEKTKESGEQEVVDTHDQTLTFESDTVPVGEHESMIEVGPSETHVNGQGGFEDVRALLEAAEAGLAEKNEQYLRIQAELQNVRQRAERDISRAHKFALENFATELLPVMDSMEQGLQMVGQADATEAQTALVQGIQLTMKLFLDTLKKFGVEQIDPYGQPFDPSFHEAMSMQENDDVEANTVLAVFQKGYSLNGRLIRAARVVVSRPSSTGANPIDVEA